MSFYNRCVTSAERKERDTDDVTVQRHPTLHNFVCVAVTLDSACSVARGDYVLPTIHAFALSSNPLQTFTVAGPKAWNSPPQTIRNVE